MKILLVIPCQDIEPYILPNLGLGYLSSALRNKGHEVSYLDSLKEAVNTSTWKRILHEGQYELVGIQMYSYAYNSVKSMFKTAKDILPNVINVAGGPHVNALPEQTLRDNPEIDYAIHGEGERAFRQLVDMLEHSNFDNGISIPGVAWRDKGHILVNQRLFIEDIDEIDLPAWDLMDPRTYPILSHGLLNRAHPIAPILATRGCPYNCTFCSARANMGSKVRKRTPSKVVDEIQMLVEEYGVKEIHFEDDNFTFCNEFASEVCQIIIDRGIKVFWACPSGVRLDSLDAKLLKLMERSGCFSFALGIESGSDRILKMMRKGTSSQLVRQKIRLVAETTKIRMTGFFMFGYPGENEDDLKQTRTLILNEPLHRISVGPFLPLPGTQIYDNLVREKKISKEYNWNLLSPYEENVFVTGSVNQKRLFQTRRMIHLRFYLRPRIIIKILSEINSLEQFKVGLRMFLFWLGIVKIKKR
ncbi:B12-binding domain-containing radical SAM protein [bacterium]|nr:B12-binding domain-containing radical SAM protein [bacterium]